MGTISNDIGYLDSDWARDQMRRIGISQSNVAQAIDRDDSSVSRMLLGQRRVTIAQVPKLAAVLGVPVRVVLARTGLDVEDTWTPPPAQNGADCLIPELPARGSRANAAGYWQLPLELLEGELKVRPEAARMVRVVSDDMVPTLHPDDRILVDTDDVAPSPPGIFAIDDGVAVLPVRINLIPGSEPPTVRITGDNARAPSYDAPADRVRILGRVRWTSRRV